MSYVKQTWVDLPSTASPVSADRLNHMEDGIGADAQYANLDTVGVGVISGLVVSAQSSPNMTVSASSGITYLADGNRYSVDANTAVAITTANATNPRKDIIYVNSSGITSYLAGTAASTPVAPTLPTGGTLEAEIYVGAGVTSILTANITDKRTIIKTNVALSARIEAEILSERTGSTGTVSLATNFTDAGNTNLKKRGVIAYLTVEAINTVTSITAYSQFTLGTLPFGYRPLKNHYITGQMEISGNDGFVFGYISTDGVIYITPTVSATTTITKFSTSFIMEDFGL